MRHLRQVRWKEIVRSTASASYRHDCTDVAAAMAFEFVFAIFPFILVLTASLVVTGIPPELFTQRLIDLGIVVPVPILKAVDENVKHLWNAYQSLFVFGVIGVVFPASASMSTTMSAMNRAYEVKESRSFWRRRALSLVLVVSLGISLVILFNLFVFGTQLEEWLTERWFEGGAVPTILAFSRRATGTIGTVAVVACIYRLAPDIRQRWIDVLPGSLLFLLLWSAIAAGFTFFIDSLSYYTIVTGLLSGVIVLLLCAYLVALVLLIGGELNGALYTMRNGPRPSVAAVAGAAAKPGSQA